MICICPLISKRKLESPIAFQERVYMPYITYIIISPTTDGLKKLKIFS